MRSQVDTIIVMMSAADSKRISLERIFTRPKPKAKSPSPRQRRGAFWECERLLGGLLGLGLGLGLGRALGGLVALLLLGRLLLGLLGLGLVLGAGNARVRREQSEGRN